MNAKLTAKQTEALQLVATGNVIAIVRGFAGFETINGNTENKLIALKLIEKKAAGTRVRNGFEIEIFTWVLTAAGREALGLDTVEEPAAETMDVAKIKAAKAENKGQLFVITDGIDKGRVVTVGACYARSQTVSVTFADGKGPGAGPYGRGYTKASARDLALEVDNARQVVSRRRSGARGQGGDYAILRGRLSLS